MSLLLFAFLFYFVFSLADASKIRWENRFVGQKGDKCLVTIDGTTYKVHNLTKLKWSQRKEWYDYKHNHFGIKYEIAVCIVTGWIVHYNGPFKGSIHDLTIFRWGLKKLLSLLEKVMADLGYVGDATVITPKDATSNQHRLAMKELRKRHETINGKMKTFECLRNQWRHSLDKHHIAFRGCLVIVQLCIENGREVYNVEGYSDPIFD